ncbi:hypothetical protein THIAE_06115 [Thiomicrospira aerophila AL3]|uniref:Integrating conjugative element membrane protein n=1 Tax=Thiomicrospira aerophila AL3 TaxID=717772 RepID=W0DVT5_9GAMM|nr:DUF4400 domain-containing protein [Thiomicrospira aerophila]AHF01398.1 hypothetical protein THIAE_06115 [Thiomicrospira aerophila AL3]
MAAQQEKVSFFGAIVGLFFGMIGAIIGALFLSIIFEWVGMFFNWWTLPGSEHAKMMLDREISWVSSDFKAAMITPLSVVTLFTEYAYFYLVKFTGLEWLVLKFQGSVFYDYGLAMIYIIELTAVRLAVILLSLPALFLFGLFALVDGLVERDLRTWGGGRETSFVYHHARKWISLFLYLPVMLYISAPWSIHPSIFVLVFALPFGYTVWLAATYFKKYL